MVKFGIGKMTLMKKIYGIPLLKVLPKNQGDWSDPISLLKEEIENYIKSNSIGYIHHESEDDNID